jgi:transposase
LYAGIDTHKDTLAVAVVDEQGRQVAGDEVLNTEDGFGRLTALFQRHGVTRVGIEGSGGFGRAVAVHFALLNNLVDESPVDPVGDRNGHTPWSVVEVPTLMTSRERRAQVGQGKTDPVDALAIARITARDATSNPAGGSKLAPVRLTIGPAADLRALLDYRDDLLLERTALANRAHADLTGLSPGYQHQVRTLTTRARVRRVLELIADNHSVRADLTRRRLERIMVIDAEAAQLKRDIAALVTAAGSTLTDIHGVGPLVAGRFLAEVVDARRYPTTNAFAAANGTAPIPASSGRTVRHRYNPGGNRQLNRALYTVALTQIASDTEGRAYYRRKRAEGKTGREALRCLKRRISDRVYRTMLQDAKTAGHQAGQQAGEPSGERPGERPQRQLAVGASDAHEVRLTA